jgi:hypothetical protein
LPVRKRAAQRSTARSAPTWIVLRVAIVAKSGEPLDPPPGRDLLVSTLHTFADLAAAIDRAFARWDLAHLHEFRLPDGRVIGVADADEFGADENEIDDRTLTIGAARLALGDSFEYVFDLGDDWEHTCTVARVNVDPTDEWGGEPREIVAVFGWGVLPDQYGRLTPDPTEPDEGDAV